MSYFNSTYNEGGVSYWTGFNDPETGSIPRLAGSNGSFIPGSHRLKFNDNFFNERNTNEEVDFVKIDFVKEKNKTEHHCSLYSVQNLVVRRGQEFQVVISLNIPYNRTSDSLQLVFSKGTAPKESRGTLIRLHLYHDKASAEKAKKAFDWLAYITPRRSDQNSATVNVTIKPNADALVGSYTVKTVFHKKDLDGSMIKLVQVEKEPVYVFFNAWCKDDQVYMSDEKEREEYINNETGNIWVGSSFWNHGRKWNFGQFAKACTEAAVYLLEHSDLSTESHGNATLVCRVMSAKANSNSWDNGVLTGNWSGDYGGGTSPSKWNGSVEILQQYMETKRAVEYGQCWVFSGLLTTLCRALGIPTRSVTNFDSAHDSDYSMTIDTHLDEEGGSLDHLDDSVWNFHVWNEAWLKRPDLPSGYDGWQAFDATPQELSDNSMQCGPAPLKAIKEGNVYLGFDTKFVFAEVNADRITWIVDKENKRTPIKEKTQESTIGNKISTKSIGSSIRNDVTHLYKYPEGDPEERLAVARACHFSSRKTDLGDFYADQVESDVVFGWKDEMDGGDIVITFSMENKSDQERRVYCRATANATFYTGVLGKKLGDSSGVATLAPGQKTESALKLRARYYLNIIEEDATAKIMIFGKVLETKQRYHKEKIFDLQTSDPVLEVSNDRPKVREEFTLTIKITNPFKVSLTSGVINLEGPGIQKNREILISEPISEGAEISRTVTLKAKYPGKREMIVCFNCRQLTNMSEAIMIDVQPAGPPRGDKPMEI